MTSADTSASPTTKDFSITDSSLMVPSTGSNTSAVSDSYNYHVKAGLQRVLQVFITNSGNVFLLDSSDALPSEVESKLSEQVSVILFLYNLTLIIPYPHIFSIF